MRIAICDDIKSEHDQFIKALHGRDPTRRTECCLTGVALLEAAKQEPPFDIVFLDIYMPGENGVEIAGDCKKFLPKQGLRLSPPVRNTQWTLFPFMPCIILSSRSQQKALWRRSDAWHSFTAGSGLWRTSLRDAAHIRYI